MATDGSRPPIRAPAPRDCPILDRTLLSRQCFGDEALEAELIALFREQAVGLAARLAGDANPPGPAQADVAHRLRGSALAIGAARVAEAAALVEACGRAGAGEGRETPERAVEMAQAIATLSDAVAEAVAEIDRIAPMTGGSPAALGQA